MSTEKILSLQFEELRDGELKVVEVCSGAIYYGGKVMDITEHCTDSGAFSYVLHRYAVGNVRLFKPVKIVYYSGE